jgi:hypothetical protein
MVHHLFGESIDWIVCWAVRCCQLDLLIARRAMRQRFAAQLWPAVDVIPNA